MSKVKVSVELIEEMIFGSAPHPVRIKELTFADDRRTVVFDVSGEDVPSAENVTAIITRQKNRAGQVFNTMSFEPSS